MLPRRVAHRQRAWEVARRGREASAGSQGCGRPPSRTGVRLFLRGWVTRRRWGGGRTTASTPGAVTSGCATSLIAPGPSRSRWAGSTSRDVPRAGTTRTRPQPGTGWTGVSRPVATAGRRSHRAPPRAARLAGISGPATEPRPSARPRSAAKRSARKPSGSSASCGPVRRLGWSPIGVGPTRCSANVSACCGVADRTVYLRGEGGTPATDLQLVRAARSCRRPPAGNGDVRQPSDSGSDGLPRQSTVTGDAVRPVPPEPGTSRGHRSTTAGPSVRGVG